jgi:hypothetical protein
MPITSIPKKLHGRKPDDLARTLSIRIDGKKFQQQSI